MQLTEPSVKAWLPLSLYTQLLGALCGRSHSSYAQKTGVGHACNKEKIHCKWPKLWLTKSMSHPGGETGPRGSRKQNYL